MFQTGTGITDYQALLTALANIATGNHADSATVQAGGASYNVGDILTVVGGTGTYTATFQVLTLGGGGAVATVKVINGGAYTVNPTNPVSTTVAPAGGSGCTLNLSMSATGWSLVRNTTPGGEKEMIFQGVGSGSDTIYVGIKTYQQVNGPNTAYNWVMIGATGFNSGLNFENQPGVSPNGVPAAAGGAYMALKTSDGFPMSFWFNITGRRMWGVVKVENAVITYYQSFYLGFLNPFGTTTEFPYPIYVCGTTSRHDCLFNTGQPSITGIVEVVAINGKTGPGYIRLPNGTWQSVQNSLAVDTGSPSRAASQLYVVYPCGQPALSSFPSGDDKITQNVATSVFSWNNLAPTVNIPGSPAQRLKPTPNSGGAMRPLFPCTVILTNSPDFDVWGELDGVFWVSAQGGETNGDTVSPPGDGTYLIFQQGGRNTPFSFGAYKTS